MSTLDGETRHVPDQLVEQLLKGYDALSAEIKMLDERRRELENKVSWSKQQYLDTLKRFSPENAPHDFRTFLDELDEAGACQQEKPADWLEFLSRSTDPGRRSRAYNIQRAEDAREKLRYRQGTSTGTNDVRIWNGRSADSTGPAVDMEHDFTTPGTPGRLRCPFVPPPKLISAKPPSTNNRGVSTPRSSMSRISLSGQRSKRSSFHDPIRAEICGQKPVSTAPSIEGSVPLCPIRFMDQHSPEEVAQYFEKHKHELPRSHEVCVKRYQTNEASIRQLDAKYGNLINMIQGLGNKHKPMLPERQDDENAVDDNTDEPSPKDRVQNWATAVSVSLEPDAHERAGEAPIEDDRQSHFDRPLKDVRVGESPSRPWGITVPARYVEGLEFTSAKSDPTASPLDTPLVGENDQPAKATCPFGHGAGDANPHIQPKAHAPQPPPPTRHEAQSRAQQHIQPSFFHRDPPRPGASSSKEDPGMVFTGPVFIGYPMEQALTLLQQSGYGDKR